jgi:acyl-CoA synthetase (AMP-forming)/AMP-acid ligase II
MEDCMWDRAWSDGFLPDARLTLLEAIAQHRDASPDRTAMTAVRRAGTALAEHPVTFAELDARAREAAAELERAGVDRGDRVILAVQRPERFLAYFLGASGLGAIPVPLPPLLAHEMPRVFTERLTSVVADCQPALAVVDAPRALEAVGEALGVPGIDAAAPSSAPPSARFAWRAERADVAFLQYTSGSTGQPKGVIVTHENLVANFRAIAGGAEFGPDERCVSWLPLFHDMGIVGGLLLGLYMRTEAFILEPEHFMLRPVAWLEAMTKYRATFTVAPNFAYSLVARRLSDRALAGVDLSALRLAFDGAEPIDRPTVEAFVRRLAGFGFHPEAFYPVYGLAECTLAAAFPKPGSGARFRRVDRARLIEGGVAAADEAGEACHVSVGRAVPSMTLFVAAPGSDAPLGDGVVGEVVVRGPSVSPGYWGRPPRESALVRTGDLGYLVDGELYLVDRLKDLIILGGRNFAPSDLEQTAARVAGVTRGAIAAFGVPGEDGTEVLCVVAALTPKSLRPASQITDEIRKTVTASFGVTPKDVVLVRAGAMPKTSSGKVRRRTCRAMYLEGKLDVVDGLGARLGMQVQHLKRQVGGYLALQRDDDGSA